MTSELGSEDIWKYQKSVQTPQNGSLVAKPSAKIKILFVLVKKSQKTTIKLSEWYAISHENQSWSKLFCN